MPMGHGGLGGIDAGGRGFVEEEGLAQELVSDGCLGVAWGGPKASSVRKNGLLGASSMRKKVDVGVL